MPVTAPPIRLTLATGPEELIARLDDKAGTEYHIFRPTHPGGRFLLAGDTVAAILSARSPGGLAFADCDGTPVLAKVPASLPIGQRLTLTLTHEAMSEPGHHRPPRARLATPDAPLTASASLPRALAALMIRADQVTLVRPPLPGLWGINLADLVDQAMALLPRPVPCTSLIGDPLDWSATLAPAPFQSLNHAPARLSIERTRAGLVLDVDGDGPPDALNRAAAIATAQLLRRWQVGGATLIDFLTCADRDQRASTAALFDQHAAADPRPFERTAINGYGLLHIIRPRPRASLLDHWLGTGNTGPAPETAARLALITVSQSVGIGPSTLTVPPPVALALDTFGAARRSVEAALGAPLLVRADPAASFLGDIHVHVR